MGIKIRACAKSKGAIVVDSAFRAKCLLKHNMPHTICHRPCILVLFTRTTVCSSWNVPTMCSNNAMCPCNIVHTMCSCNIVPSMCSCNMVPTTQCENVLMTTDCYSVRLTRGPEEMLPSCIMWNSVKLFPETKKLSRKKKKKRCGQDTTPKGSLQSDQWLPLFEVFGFPQRMCK